MSKDISKWLPAALLGFVALTGAGGLYLAQSGDSDTASTSKTTTVTVERTSPTTTAPSSTTTTVVPEQEPVVSEPTYDEPAPQPAPEPAPAPEPSPSPAPAPAPAPKPPNPITGGSPCDPLLGCAPPMDIFGVH